MTALLWATDLGCDPVVQFLIENNVDVNAVDGCLQTALHFGMGSVESEKKLNLHFFPKTGIFK